MVHRITQALGRIKADLGRLLEPAIIVGLCQEAGHQWRERRLDPVTTIHLFVLQILHGNTACSHLPHLAKLTFTASAYCQARARLPLEVLQKLLSRIGEALEPLTQETGRWFGHRVFALDGSGFSMPDTPELQQAFGQPGGQKAGCGFPVAHLLALFHAGTGLLTKVLAAPPRTHDLSQAPALHPELSEGDLLLGDRGFCSYAHFALLGLRKVQAVFRAHQRQIVDFTPGRPHLLPGQGQARKGVARSRWLRQLGVTDQRVEWFKPASRPDWMTEPEYAALPLSIVLRELRYRVGRPGFRTQQVTLVTTLLDAERYPVEALAELYRSRWRVETHLAHLKRTMKMDVLRCETVGGVRKELILFAWVYNLVRVVMLEAARRQQVAAERISFVDTLRWLATAGPDEPLPDLIVNAPRPNRVEPRVRKRRAKEYPVMKAPRSELRKLLLSNAVTV